MGDRRNDHTSGIGEKYSGYQVYDRRYEKVGKVEDLFVDEDDRLEYIGVKTGFLGSRSTLVPMEIVRLNPARELMQVDSEKDTIRESPAFDGDEEITLDFENRVHAHFGTRREGPRTESYAGSGYGPYYGEELPTGAGEGSGVDVLYGERADARMSGAPETRGSGELRGRAEEAEATDAARREREDAGEVGPGMAMGDTESGEFRGHASDDEGVRQRSGSDLEDEDELRVQRSEEELRAGTRERETGSVNVRKRVRIDRERMSVPTRHEEVSVERVPAESREASETDIGEEEVRMPVTEEEVVTDKKAVKKEEVRVRKDVVEDTEIVEEDVRKEEVEVEDATERGGRRRKE